MHYNRIEKEILSWHLVTVYPITFFAQSLIRKKMTSEVIFLTGIFLKTNVINDLPP
jgi:hypothetical protein